MRLVVWGVVIATPDGRKIMTGKVTSVVGCARGKHLALFIASWGLFSCGSTVDPGFGEEVPTEPAGGVGGSGPVPTPAGGDVPFGGGIGVGGSVAVTDDRPPVLSEVPPPPISGGTLLALADGKRVVVSDPDRDRLVVANYQGLYLDGLIDLGDGAQPGRLVEGDGVVYVILRGTGEVATLDLGSLEISERRAVCAEPRGLALTPDRQRLVVACAEGKLVELPLFDAEAANDVPLDLDLRDVLFAGDRLMVTRLRSAELLELDADRQVISRQAPPLVAETLRAFDGVNVLEDEVGLFEPAVAWRAAAGPGGSVVVVHQRATPDPIALHEPHGTTHEPKDPDDPADPEDPETPDAPIDPGIPQDAAYGAGLTGCGGIVHTAVTTFRADGTIVTSPQIAGVVLPFDVAVSKNGQVAVANGGARDFDVSGTGFFFFGSAVVLSDFELDRASGSGSCAFPSSSVGDGLPAIAVTFDPTGNYLITQTREPSQLGVTNLSNGQLTLLPMAGESVEHTGHEIFHRDSGGGIACASCHVEGSEDGRVWNFDAAGLRRTQPLDVKLEGTAPFHWDGEHATFTSLMTDVFQGRMGGPEESPERQAALQEWIFALGPRPGPRVPDEASARGQAIFESREAGCQTCHAGARFSNNGAADVGTGGLMQVPSLLGLANRPPFLHTGCAQTLADRFDPACGGDAHGDITSLSDAEVDDLIAYLETL